MAAIKTRRTSALVIKTLLHVAQPGARLLIVGSGAFLVNPATHDHWYTNSSTFESLRANEWITAPTAIDANVAECSITDAGQQVAAAIESAKHGYTQLALEEVLEQIEAAAAKIEQPVITTDQPIDESKESNPTMITTFERVAPHIAEVTFDQIGKCHKLIKDGQEYYAVENERGDRDMDGEIMQYAVKYSAERGYSCTCAAGAAGFATVHHASGVCKHVRWTVACQLEERAYMRDLAAKQAKEEEAARRQDQDGDEATNRAHVLIINGKEASPREYARVMLAQPAQLTETEIKRDQEAFAPRPFRLER